MVDATANLWLGELWPYLPTQPVFQITDPVHPRGPYQPMGALPIHRDPVHPRGPYPSTGTLSTHRDPVHPRGPCPPTGTLFTHRDPVHPWDPVHPQGLCPPRGWGPYPPTGTLSELQLLSVSADCPPAAGTVGLMAGMCGLLGIKRVKFQNLILVKLWTLPQRSLIHMIKIFKLHILPLI